MQLCRREIGMSNAFKISKKALCQYMLIYIMLLLNQSNFFAFYIDGSQGIQLILILLFSATLLLRHRRKAQYGFHICLFMLLAVIFERFWSGGVGISYWCEIALKVLIVYLAFCVDEEHFLDRFLKLVSILASISILLWGLQILNINLPASLFTVHDTRNIQVEYDYQGNRSAWNYKCYGLFLYSYLTYYPNRNVGIFTEPGIYQAVLNSALFVLLFMNEWLHIDVSKRKKYVILFSVALVTTQSTSGYLGFLATLLVLLLSRNEDNSINWKKMAVSLSLAVLIGLGIDLAIRGEDSLLNVAFISKLFDNSNRLSLVAENSTGKYRMASLLMSLQAMLNHPLGLGYEGWISYSSINELSGAGGFPLKLGAVLGIIPLLYLMIWIFSPLKNLRKGWKVSILFVFLYFNTSLAQTSAVYPVLIMIPIILKELDRDRAIKMEGYHI